MLDGASRGGQRGVASTPYIGPGCSRRRFRSQRPAPPLLCLQYTPPGELLEGYTRSVDDNPISRFLGRRDAAFAPPERLELDLEDPTAFNKQLYDQVGAQGCEVAGSGSGRGSKQGFWGLSPPADLTLDRSLPLLSTTPDSAG